MKFHVVKGSVKQNGKWLGYGEVVELSEAEAKHIDPEGVRLASEAKFKALAAKKEAEKQLAAAEKAEAKAEQKGGK